MNIRRAIEHRIQVWTNRVFPLWQRLGVHVLPNHFYSPIPDTRSLHQNLWLSRSEMPGVDLRPQHQLILLDEICRRFRSEYETFPREPSGIAHQYFLSNHWFGSVDAEIYYGLIRVLRPRRVFEIGCGNSTYVAAQAVEVNRREGAVSRLVGFEPYPKTTLVAGFPGLSQLVRTGAQQVPLSTFAELEADDILFVDSTHALKVGGDVQFLFLEVLPRLRPGVVVHFHDIFLPYEYPRSWVLEGRLFFTEQYVLQAFLSFNDRFEVLWGSSYMHRTHPDRLRAAFPAYADGVGLEPGAGSPSSFWIRRVK